MKCVKSILVLFHCQTRVGLQILVLIGVLLILTTSLGYIDMAGTLNLFILFFQKKFTKLVSSLTPTYKDEFKHVAEINESDPDKSWPLSSATTGRSMPRTYR